jgi:ABC-type Zn uptake system ZnuABC Zn-binding protein ZnuA
MKCKCKKCDGFGFVPCRECNGEGYYASALTRERGSGYIFSTDPEIIACVSAARHVVKQAEALSEIFPARRETYRRQMETILAELETEAEALVKGVGA